MCACASRLSPVEFIAEKSSNFPCKRVKAHYIALNRVFDHNLATPSHHWQQQQ